MKSSKPPYDNLRETMVSSRCLHNATSFSFWTDEVRLPNGKRGTRDYVRYPEAVAILPLLNNAILFVRQYRYAPGCVLLEIPAGKQDTSESLEETVHRELREETGYDAHDIEPLVSYYPCPGYSNERIHTYVARNLVPSPLESDEDEFISTETLSLDDALEAIESGSIQDGKTILALLAYKNTLKRTQL